MQYLTISWCIIWSLITAVAFHHFSSGENDIVVLNDSEGVIDGIPDEESLFDETNTERFIPTHEWQVIKKGQSIPAGLHVRMDFQTGIKEAKLLETEGSEKPKIKFSEEETKKTRKGPKIILADDQVKDSVFLNDKLHFKKSHLKQVLHNFKDKIGTKDIEHVTWSDDAKDMLQESLGEEQKIESTKKSFRSMEDIKKDLEKNMGWNVKSDVQIMQDILKQLKAKNSSIDEKSHALDSLEDYVHQVDNGKDFEKIGGLKEVVALLNSSSEILQEKAANLIGAAAQSNKEVQEAFQMHRGLPLLIRMLDFTKLKLTQKKGLYAVSAVIRGNQHVQSEFVKYGGLGAVLKLMKLGESNAIKVKAVTLMYDLIVEQNEVLQRMVETGKMQPGNNESPLLKSLLDAGWCHLLVPMLQSEDYDSKEKVIQALVVSVKSCHNELKQEPSLTELKKQVEIFDHSIQEEDDADFKSYLVDLKQQLQENVLNQLIPPPV